VATREEAQQSLFEKMEDPSISKDEFDELNRRVKALDVKG
jgi:hypothetical protein